jgi:CRISPR-associated protein Cas1
VDNLRACYDALPGDRAVGVDGVTKAEYGRHLEENLMDLSERLRRMGYRPKPKRRSYIPKPGSEKGRPLAISCFEDKIVELAVKRVLEPIYETVFEGSSYGYRPRCGQHQCLDALGRTIQQARVSHVVEADICGFFGEIDQDLLMREVETLVEDPGILDLIRLWLRAEVQDGDRSYRLTRGVPQGSPLSSLLSNLYLDHLDETLLNEDLKLVRFSDDFVVLCRNRAAAEQALELTGEVLEGLRLALHEEKPRVVDFDHGFRFLGVQFIRSMAFKARYREAEPSSAGFPMPARSRSPPGPVSTDSMPGPDEERVPGQGVGDTSAAFPESGDPSLEAETPDEFVPPEESEAALPAGHDPRLRTLYLLQHGQVLGKESQRLVVRHEDKVVNEIPAIKVDQIMVFGNAQITTQAMQFCLRQRIPIYLLSARGRHFGVVDSFDTDPVLLQREQFRRADEPDFCLDLARGFVRGKIANSRIVLQRQSCKREAPALNEGARRLKGVLQRSEKAQTLDELRGFEGTAARIYFAAVVATLDASWRFNGRNRQPPLDPVNAMLSYGYTLLFYNIYSLLRARGLNPHVGYLQVTRRWPQMWSRSSERSWWMPWYGLWPSICACRRPTSSGRSVKGRAVC